LTTFQRISSRATWKGQVSFRVRPCRAEKLVEPLLGLLEAGGRTGNDEGLDLAHGRGGERILAPASPLVDGA